MRGQGVDADYTGGEFSFVDPGPEKGGDERVMTLQPKCGKLVFFTSGSQPRPRECGFCVECAGSARFWRGACARRGSAGAQVLRGAERVCGGAGARTCTTCTRWSTGGGMR